MSSQAEAQFLTASWQRVAANKSPGVGRFDDATRRALATKWNMPAELAIDVAGLALYDVIIMAGVPSCTIDAHAIVHGIGSTELSASLAQRERQLRCRSRPLEFPVGA